MKRLLCAGSAALLLTAGLSGCGGATAKAPSLSPPPAVALNQQVVNAQVGFGLTLLQHLREAEPAKNIFISPASASLVLSLTANGARGETRDGMTAALAQTGIDPVVLNETHGALQTILANPDPKVKLNVANAIWYRKGWKVDPAFSELSKRYYRAEISPAEFDKPAAVNAINRWVDRATEGKIKQMLKETNPDDAMVLVNAIYFNGQWTEPFPAENTRERAFTRIDGSVKQYPMMTVSGTFRYYKGDSMQAVSLPYGNGRVSMYLFLPDPSSDVGALTRSVSADRWAGWMEGFKQSQGTVTMPKVKLDYAAELKEPLKAMGMAKAFEAGAAEFGGLFQDVQVPMFIASVLQKTHLNIDERGTEAAAATAVTVRAGSAPVEKPFELVFDRPFLMAIRDNKTGALLFVGVIVDPV